MHCLKLEQVAMGEKIRTRLVKQMLWENWLEWDEQQTKYFSHGCSLLWAASWKQTWTFSGSGCCQSEFWGVLQPYLIGREVIWEIGENISLVFFFLSCVLYNWKENGCFCLLNHIYFNQVVLTVVKTASSTPRRTEYIHVYFICERPSHRSEIYHCPWSEKRNHWHR